MTPEFSVSDLVVIPGTYKWSIFVPEIALAPTTDPMRKDDDACFAPGERQVRIMPLVFSL